MFACMKAEERRQIDRMRDMAHDNFEACKQLAADIARRKAKGDTLTARDLQDHYDVDLELLRAAYLDLREIRATAPDDVELAQAVAKAKTYFDELGEPLPM